MCREELEVDIILVEWIGAQQSGQQAFQHRQRLDDDQAVQRILATINLLLYSGSGRRGRMRIQFLPDQEEILSELREMAESNEEDEETMDAKVLKVSALLIMHSDYAP